MIHPYRLFDTNIVLDVNSGAVHVFDDTSFNALLVYNDLKKSGFQFNDENALAEKVRDALSAKSSCPEKEITEAIGEIRELERKGLLFSDDCLSWYKPDLNEEIPIKALCLHVSHDCNMRCDYCFASKGDFGTGRKLMDRDTALRSIDFLVENSRARKNLEVDFFGGEPLMNSSVIFDTVKYARSLEGKYDKRFRFTVTTNGLLLTPELMDYFNREFDNVVMSLDGAIETNDRMRKLPNGRGTYSHVLPGIKMAVMKRGGRDHFIRGTFTAHNTDFSRDVLHLADTGFKSISVEPVVASPDCDYALTVDMLPRIFSEYEKLALEYAKRREEGRAFSFFHFEIDLEQGPCVKKLLKGCGAGYEYVAVTPEGDIYPCHQFVGKKDFVLGNVHDNGGNSINKEISRMFRRTDITTKSKCTNCWAKFHCSGGCVASAYLSNGNLEEPYEIGCQLEKKRIECAIWLKTNQTNARV
jgi:uncharacterized protein